MTGKKCSKKLDELWVVALVRYTLCRVSAGGEKSINPQRSSQSKSSLWQGRRRRQEGSSFIGRGSDTPQHTNTRSIGIVVVESFCPPYYGEWWITNTNGIMTSSSSSRLSKRRRKRRIIGGVGGKEGGGGTSSANEWK